MHSPQTEVSRPPEGFRPIQFRKGFMQVNGPLYMRPAGDSVEFGVRVEERHCNAWETAHGGFLMTFMDMVLPMTIGWALDRAGPFLTVSMAGDYLGAVPQGAWLEGRGRLVRATRSLAFAEGMASVGGEPLFRANITCKLPRTEAGRLTPRQMYERQSEA
jgi:acyl-coenzyme A thioesterase PaaI-like protein